MKLEQVDLALKTIEGAKERAFAIYNEIIDEEGNTPLLDDDEREASRTLYGLEGKDYDCDRRKWGEVMFSTAESITDLSIDTYGIEQHLSERRIEITLAEQRYMRGEYTVSDSIQIPEWLFDDPSEANICKFVSERYAQIRALVEERRRARETEASEREAARRQQEHEEYQRLKKVFESEK